MIESAEELSARATRARPGDVLVVRDGVYADWRVSVPCKGSEGRPITIMPETPGGVTFRLNTRIDIRGDWIVLRGFRFDHCSQLAVHIAGGSHNRVTQCQFFHCGTAHTTFAHILRVDMGSHYNRVDHCYWTGSKCMSVGQRNHHRYPENVGTHNRYDHNVFRDIVRIWINGQENIQLGQGVPFDAELLAVVEYNLFDYAWGDGEIFSSKTSRNTFRYNVAANCVYSAFTLRGGDHAVVDGNVLINNGGGIRIFDRGHTITNNLIADCAGAAITFQIGHAVGKSRGIPAAECLIANNTFVNNAAGIAAAGSTDREDWRPRGNRVVNNIFVSNAGLCLSPDGHEAPVVEDNLFWTTAGAGVGMAGVRALIADPKLQGQGADLRPSAGSPAIDRAGRLPAVTHDRQGNRRPRGAGPDLGADEWAPPGVQPARRLLPHVPAPRVWSIEFFKGDSIFAHDDGHPLAGWKTEGSVRAQDRAVAMQNGAMTLGRQAPPDFVLEWECQPAAFAAKGAVVFCAGPGAQGYRLTWGGAAKDGKPSGIVTLEKNGQLIAECPDTVYYRRNYIPSYPNRMIAITSSEPNPLLWYQCRLLRRRGEIRLILNTAARVSKGKPHNVRDVPVVIWEDTGDVAGPLPAGGRISFVQQGAGLWRNVRLWKAEYMGDVPPAAPAGLAATAAAGGYVALTWAPGDPGRSGIVYDVFRASAPDFEPAADNQVGWAVDGPGVADFRVEPNTAYHYKVRGVNLLGRMSSPVSVSVTAGRAVHQYAAVRADAFASIEAPMVVRAEPRSGLKYVTTAKGSGMFMKAPPAKGHVEYEVAVAKPGKHRLWARVVAPGAGSNSFYVCVPTAKSGQPIQCHVGVTATWRWARLGRQVELAKGSQKIRILPRESGTRLSEILVTSDLDWKPLSR